VDKIAQYGAYEFYPNGDRDADDFPPRCNCISCGPTTGHQHIPTTRQINYNRLHRECNMIFLPLKDDYRYSLMNMDNEDDQDSSNLDPNENL